MVLLLGFNPARPGFCAGTLIQFRLLAMTQLLANQMNCMFFRKVKVEKIDYILFHQNK
mgnify:CR=1 FL=1